MPGKNTLTPGIGIIALSNHILRRYQMKPGSKVLMYLFGSDLWKSRLGVMSLTSLLSLLWFVVDWCSFTTFRAMSDWILYANNILAAMLLTLPFLFTRRIWVQLLWLCMVDILLLADIMYCRTYFTSIPLDSFGLVGNLADFTSSIYTSLGWMDIGFLMILAAGVWWGIRTPLSSAPRRILRYLSCIALMALVSFVGIACRGGFYKEYDRLIQSCYYSTCGTPTYTFAGHLAYSLLELRKNSPSQTTAEYDNWLEEHRKLMPLPSLHDSLQPRKNLVVILCESLESWPIGAEIKGRPITPYLNSLIADSTTFYAPNMLTQVASGRSIDCQLLLHAGMLPMNGPVYSMKHPSSTYLTLNKALKEKYGSRSVIFTCDKPITWNQEVISRSFGYDTLIDRRGWKIDELVGNPGKLSDGSFMRQCVEKLRNGNLWQEGSPMMLTFVTYSGHSPFRLPDNMKDPQFDLSAVRLPDKLKDYITMAHYTDSCLRTLIEYLKLRSDYGETLILITGDHEGLATWRREIRANSKEAAELVSEGQFTPFILLNSPVTGKYEGMMGQIDMYPTLLSLLGIEDYVWPGLGQSIFSPGYHGIAISSMTGETVGDTASVHPAIFDHLRRARNISDGIIRTDYLRRFAVGFRADDKVSR